MPSQTWTWSAQGPAAEVPAAVPTAVPAVHTSVDRTQEEAAPSLELESQKGVSRLLTCVTTPTSDWTCEKRSLVVRQPLGSFGLLIKEGRAASWQRGP